MEEVTSCYGYKFKCPWCGFYHYVTIKIMPCLYATCPVYRESFRVVHDPLVCLACSKPCNKLKTTTTAITACYDPALRGVRL